MKLKLSPAQRLQALFVATVLGAVAFEGAVLAQQHHVHTGRGAFLHYQVDSTDELIAALKKNPTLRKNYAKQFGIPQDQVVDFFKRSLVTYRLPAARRVNNYGVTKGGQIFYKKTVLKKGTVVWANHSGLPILKWACANPLTNHIPGTQLTGPATTVGGGGGVHHKPQIADVASPEIDTPIPAVPAGGVAVPDFVPPVASTSSYLANGPALNGTGSAVIPAIATPRIPSIPVRGAGFAPLIPLLFLHGQNKTNASSPPTSPVPEPGSAPLALLAGIPVIGGLAARCRAKGKAKA